MSLILVILSGAFTSMQTAVNSRLSRALGSNYRSSFTSFGIGAIFLTIFALILSGGQLGLGRLMHATWWYYLGGFTGAVALTLNIILFSHLGSTQTAILPVVGQLITSALIDQFGWFNMKVINLSLWRAIGLILLLVGASAIVFKPKSHLTTNKESQLIWQILAILNGALIAIQTTTNGQLGRALGSPIKAIEVVFWIGTIILLVISLIQNRVQELPKIQAAPWWGYLGGVLGASNVVLGAWLVIQLGVGLTTSLQLVGIMTTGLMIDQFGWLGAKRRRIERLQLIGLLVLLVGAILVAIFK